MIQFRDREIVNEQLVLDGRTELYYLGPALTLRNCTLSVKIPAKALVMTRVRLIDCTVDVARVLANFRWDQVHLAGCHFKGHFTGNDFGEWPSSPRQGSIEACDFTQAHLSWCRFLGCDVRSIRLPAWPCFTIHDSVRRAAELAALPWPGERGAIIAEGFAEDPPSTVAVTLSATDLSKWCRTTPEAIKALIEGLDGVSY